MKGSRSSSLRFLPLLVFSAATTTTTTTTTPTVSVFALQQATTGILAAIRGRKRSSSKTATTLQLQLCRNDGQSGSNCAPYTSISETFSRFATPGARTMASATMVLATATRSELAVDDACIAGSNTKPRGAADDNDDDARALPIPVLTLCPKCHGEGKISKAPSKKERMRHQRKLYQENQAAKNREHEGSPRNDGNENENKNENDQHKRAKRSTSPLTLKTTTTTPLLSKNCTDEKGTVTQSPPPQQKQQPTPGPKRRWDPCPKCDQTGLCVPSSSSSSNSSKTGPPNRSSVQRTIHPRPFVAIVGGGVGGMALAVALRHRKIPFRVFEKDDRFDQRRQGYGLTLQQARRALRALGVFEPGNNESENDSSSSSSSSHSGRLLAEHAVTSTKHVVHTPDGTQVGEWGLRKWIGKGNADTEIDIDTDAGNNHNCSRRNQSEGRDRKPATTETAAKPRATRAKNKKRRQNLHVPRQILRCALWESLKEASGRQGDADRNDEVSALGTSRLTGTNTNTNSTNTAMDADTNADVQVRTDETFNISWGHRLVNIEPVAASSGRNNASTSHRARLSFRVEGSETGIVTAEADLVVGCDGIRSSVRQLFLPAQEEQISKQTTPLRYLDCVVVLGICPLGALVPGQNTGHKPLDEQPMERNQRPIELSPLLDGETVFQTADGTTRIYLMPYSERNNEYMWQLSFPVADEREALELSRKGSEALRDEALRRCGSWHAPIPEILAATPIDLVSGYPVYDRDVLEAGDLAAARGDASEVTAGDSCDEEVVSSYLPVTLLGDAAHPMSPFKGQGANQALLDALSLARALHRIHCRDGRPLEHALEHFEHEMIDRSSEKVRASSEAAKFLHTEIAIREGNVTRGAAAAAAASKSS